MFHRIVFFTTVVAALVWPTTSPGRVYAQRGHGGFHSGSRSGFVGMNGGFNRGSFQPGFGGFDHDFDHRFFDPRFDRRFFAPRFDGDFDRRFFDGDFDRRFLDPRFR